MSGIVECQACRKAFGMSHGDMVKLFQSDFFLTAKVLCGHPDLSLNLHKPVADFITQNIEDGILRILMLLPRGHFKTSMLSIAFPIWQIIRNPNITILLLHKSSTMSRRWLGAIRAKLRSELFLHFFGDLIPDNPKGEGLRWTGQEIEVRRTRPAPEATVTAFGIASVVEGGHYHIQILDDVVERAASASPSIMANAIDFLKLADPLFVTPASGIRLIIGTLWPGGFYEGIMKSRIYRHAVFGCYVDERFREFLASVGRDPDEFIDGQPIFPERFTLNDLANMEVTMGSYKFAHQMLNILATQESIRFRESEIRFYRYRLDTESCVIETSAGEKEYPLSEMFVSLCVDPASGENTKTDESAITVCGHHRQSGYIFLLEEWGAKVLTSALIDRIITTAKKWNVDTIGIEHAALQSTLRYFLADELRRRNLSFRIDKLPTKNISKVDRIIDGFQPYVSSGQVRFLKEHRNTIIQQMLDLSVRRSKSKVKFAGSSPNRVDSLAMHVPYWGGHATRPGEMSIDDGVEEVSDLELAMAGPVYGLECFT